MKQQASTPKTNHTPFGGVWRSHYRYHSDSRDGDFEADHYVRVYQTGHFLIVETIPGVNRSYIIIRLSLDDNVATGTWQEETDPDGYYQGAIYHGAVQVIVAKDHKSMKGKWIGFGRDGEINTGPWELKYIGDQLPGAGGRK